MTIQFQLGQQDLFAMQKDVITHSRTHDVKGKYFKWGIPFILLAFLLLIFGFSLVGVIISVVIAGAFFFIAPILYPKMAFSKLKRQMEHQDYAHLLKPSEMHFTEEGIERVIDGETTHFPWNEFRKLHEDENHYFLYVDDLQGIIIPKEPTVKDGDSKTFQENLIAYAEAYFAADTPR